MNNLHFKTRAYKKYAPALYKAKKFTSTAIAALWKLNDTEKQQLTNYRWDRFLAKKFATEAKFLGGKQFDISQLKRNSDTIFVLGCGASINDLTEEQWQLISSHDSVGVNYFYAHSFRPTFHMIELGQSDKSMECINKHLLSRPDRKNETIFMQIRHLLKRTELELDNCNSNLYFYSPSVPKGTSTKMLTKVIKRWFRKKNLLMHHSSNLDCTIHFAYQAGYKKIYLLGVDLNSNQYFWDVTQSKAQSQIDVKVATRDDYAKSKFNTDPKATHATADKTHTSMNESLTIIEYLTLLNTHVFKKHNIHFATCTTGSLLRQHFDFVELESIRSSR
jgi:hypothetical protein